MKFQHVTIAIYDVTFMVGTAYEFFRRHFGWKVFVIRLLYRTCKKKLKIQGHYPFKLSFDFIMTCVMIIYENVMKSGTNYSRNGVKIIEI